ncbi:MAG: hypothetical protein ACM31D_15735 [Bacteroidota bacterium]
MVGHRVAGGLAERTHISRHRRPGESWRFGVDKLLAELAGDKADPSVLVEPQFATVQHRRLIGAGAGVVDGLEAVRPERLGCPVDGNNEAIRLLQNFDAFWRIDLNVPTRIYGECHVSCTRPTGENSIAFHCTAVAYICVVWDGVL